MCNSVLTTPILNSGRAAWLCALCNVLIVLCGSAACGNAMAAPPDKQDLLAHADGAFALPRTETFTVLSNLGRAYRIFVWVPQQAAPKSGYSVLLLLDGNAFFPAAVSALQSMASADMPPSVIKADGVQPMMIVGVGYPGDAPINPQRREFDYLPEHASVKPPENSPNRVPWLLSGGADTFLSFLVDELRPALARRYSIDPNRQTLAGDSLGGFFTLYALFKKPDAFRNYVAISPSLWWDDQRLMTDAAKSAHLSMQGATHHILLAVGENEIPDYPDRSTLMRTLSETMATQLRRIGGSQLDVGFVELAREDHLAMPFATMPAALRLASQ
jgi:predicted alpha/beta superfamily hydrolase